MKTQLLAAAVVLATSIQAYGQNCGCESNHVVTHSVASCGCNECCTPCFNPLGELVQGVGFTLKHGACAVKRSVHSLFHPIRFNGCGCDTTPSCGCDTCGSNWDSYHPHHGEIEYIEHGVPSVPTIPGPPSTPTSEITPMQEPGKWKPVGTQARRSSAQVSHYSKRVAAKPTSRAATYYAPTPAK